MTTSAAADGMARAARGSVQNLAGAAVNTVAGLGTIWLISHHFDHVETGALLTAVGLMTMLAGAAKVGVESSITWYTASTLGTPAEATISDVVCSSLTRVFVVSAACAVTLALAIPVLSGRLVDQSVSAPFSQASMALAVGLPVWAVAQASYGVSRGFGTMTVSVLAGSVVRPLVLIGVTALLAPAGAPMWAVATAWPAAAAASLTVSLWWLYHRISFPTSGPGDHRQRFWHHARPRAGADIVHAGLERLDLVLLSAFAGSAAAADFSAAARLALLGQLILTATAQALAPVVGSHLAATRPAQARRATEVLTVWGVVATAFTMTVVVVHADTAVAVFGDSFAGAAAPLRIMAASIAAMAVLGPGDTIVTMLGETRRSLRNHLVSLGVLVVGVGALAPPFGALGAAIAWSASRLCMRLLSARVISRHLGTALVLPRGLAATVVTTVAMVTASLVVRAVGPTGAPGLLVSYLAGAVLLVSVVTVSRATTTIITRNCWGRCP